MKHILAIGLVFLIGCQTTNQKKYDPVLLNSQAAETAALYLFVMSFDGFEGIVQFLHPEYLRKLRSAIEQASTISNSNDIEEKPATNALSDANYIKLMYKINAHKYEFVELDKVSQIKEFIDGDTKYVAVKVFPSRASQRSEFVQLVALKKFDEKWYVYNGAELEKILDSLPKKPK